MWAYGLALVLAGWAYTGYQLGNARDARDDIQGRLTVLQEALATQKREAGALLQAENAKVAAKQVELNVAVALQNEKDKANELTTANLTKQLATARLRDPNAAKRGPSCSARPVAEAARPDESSTGGAEADGVLSEPLTRLLRRITREADEVNDAYIACRPLLVSP